MRTRSEGAVACGRRYSLHGQLLPAGLHCWHCFHLLRTRSEGAPPAALAAAEAEEAAVGRRSLGGTTCGPPVLEPFILKLPPVCDFMSPSDV